MKCSIFLLLIWFFRNILVFLHIFMSFYKKYWFFVVFLLKIPVYTLIWRKKTLNFYLSFDLSLILLFSHILMFLLIYWILLFIFISIKNDIFTIFQVFILEIIEISIFSIFIIFFLQLPQIKKFNLNFIIFFSVNKRKDTFFSDKTQIKFYFE